MDKELGERLFQQTMDFWVKPALKKRSEEGKIKAGTPLTAIQVLLNIDKDPIVRINEEVLGVLEVKPNRDFEKGESVLTSDIDQVTGLTLLDIDQNCAHVSMFYLNNQWSIIFDFRYNSTLIHEHLEAANEFLYVAKISLESQKHRPFIDNLFSASELISKSWLLTTPDKELMDNKKHNLIARRINMHNRLGNIDSNFIKVFNQLSNMRASARYLNNTLEISEESAKDKIQAVESMYRSVLKNSPKRHKK